MCLVRAWQGCVKSQPKPRPKKIGSAPPGRGRGPSPRPSSPTLLTFCFLSLFKNNFFPRAYARKMRNRRASILVVSELHEDHFEESYGGVSGTFLGFGLEIHIFLDLSALASRDLPNKNLTKRCWRYAQLFSAMQTRLQGESSTPKRAGLLQACKNPKLAF